VADRYCYQLRKNAFAQAVTLYPRISRFTNRKTRSIRSLILWWTIDPIPKMSATDLR
jgi:hypothetical protein